MWPFVFRPKVKPVAIFVNSPSFDPKLELDMPIAVVNKLGYMYCGKFDFWITIHGEHIETWINMRKGPNSDIPLIISAERINCNFSALLFPDSKSGGGSAVYAVEALEKLGYNQFHINGVDLTGPYKAMAQGWKNLQERGYDLVPYSPPLIKLLQEGKL